MATAEYLGYRERSRDINDLFRRGVWGERLYTDGAGSVISVRGTDSLDEDAPVLNMGYSFNLPARSNSEVFLLSQGSDTNQKFALLTIPRDLQHQWGEGEGGVQHPTDPDRRLEFNADETWLKDGDYVLGNDKELSISISGGVATIRLNGDLEIAADNINFTSGGLTHNGTNIGDTHVHEQGSDSDGDGEQDTDGPK